MPVPPGARIALRAAEDRLLLPRDRYNALQDEPSRGSSYSNITFVHFWNCQGEIGAANECAGAGTHRDATAGLRRGLRKKSPLWRETLCTRAWRAWSTLAKLRRQRDMLGLHLSRWRDEQLQRERWLRAALEEAPG